ncbi:MAG TPA: VWA domain-containing protein [Candidatus Acidoferrales bacterium]|nr:VWA domain-containing protein [Candidatus Acidoferrales bacterium]
MRRLISISLFAFSALVVAAQQPQAPPPSDAHQSSSTIRVQTEVVIEEVTVKDKNRNPIPNLKASDFVLTEDGVPQTISFVEYQEVPPLASTPQPPPAESPLVPTAPPVTSFQIAPEAPGDTKYHNHRLVALYFDRSTMGPPDQLRALEAALDFINKQMDPSVMMAVMTYDGTAVRVIQDFTGDRAEVVAAVNKLVAALSEGLDESSNDDSAADTGSSFGQDDAEFNLFNTDRQLAALETAVKMLGTINEQKALVYFASGLRLNGLDNQAQLVATENASLRSNVMLYPIDARGLVAMAPEGDATQGSNGGIGMFNGATMQAVVNRFQQSQDTLYAIAKDTGGKAFLDSNDLSLGIKQAANSITSYYEIGYYPTRTVKDGRFRRVKVSLRAGIDGELSYRQGYYADKEFAKFNATDKERQLEDALMLDNPITEINLAMEVNYFQLNSAEYFVSVDVKIPGRELALAKKGGAQETLMDTIGEVKDDFGNTIQNLRDKLNIKMDQETAAQLATHPIEYHTGFTLLPGKYSIKYLVRDNETGRIGTYQLPFNIPNLNKQLTEVPISSVVLSGQREAVTDSIYNVKQKIDATNVDPLVLNGEKLIPSVTRVFSKARDLYVYVQAYEHTDVTPVPIVAYVGLYQGQTKVFQSAPLAVVEQTQNRAKAVPIRFDVPLDKIAAGAYDCQVTVLDPSAQKAAFWQGRIVVIP